MHLGYEVVHSGELFLGCVDHKVKALIEGIEIYIGHDDCYLNNDVASDVEASHLEIKPDEVLWGVGGSWFRHRLESLRAVEHRRRMPR